MKKMIFSGVSCMAMALLLSSCYSSTVSMGDMTPTDPAVHVATAHEPHFISGLVGSTKREAKNYIGDNNDYRIKQYQSFVDGLLGVITVGFYTPTTTKFYLPYGATAPVVRKKGLPVKFGVRGGLNISSASFSEYGDAIGASSRIGFNAGIILDMPVSESFYVQPGLYYTQKGFKYDGRTWRNLGNTKSCTSTQGYVELPILASYRYPLTDDIQLQINAGPYAAVRLNNKVSDEDYDFLYFDGGSSGSFDAGLQVGAGVLYDKHYYAGIGYEWGFLEQEHTDSKNKNLFISIGYNF